MVYERRAERGGREPHGTSAPMNIKRYILYYDRESPTNNDNEKKQHFLLHKEKHKKTKKFTQTSQIV